MIRSLNRTVAALLFAALLVVVGTACNMFYVLPEQREIWRGMQAVRAEDSEWEARFKAARSRQVEDEAKLLWLQRQNLDLAKSLTLTLRGE